LKENVLIGKLIPAGSGLMAYRDYDATFTSGEDNEEAEAPAEEDVPADEEE